MLCIYVLKSVEIWRPAQNATYLCLYRQCHERLIWRSPVDGSVVVVVGNVVVVVGNVVVVVVGIVVVGQSIKQFVMLYLVIDSPFRSLQLRVLSLCPVLPQDSEHSVQVVQSVHILARTSNRHRLETMDNGRRMDNGRSANNCGDCSGNCGGGNGGCDCCGCGCGCGCDGGGVGGGGAGGGGGGGGSGGGGGGGGGWWWWWWWVVVVVAVVVVVDGGGGGWWWWWWWWWSSV